MLKRPPTHAAQQDTGAEGTLKTFDELFVHYNDALSLVATDMQVGR